MSQEKPSTHFIFVYGLLGIAVAVGLFIVSRYNYLLFHTLAEGFSIVIASAVFVVAWNTWDLTEHGYLQFLSIALLFVGGLDLVHTLAYKGMNFFAGYDANLPTQLWIATRYVQSLSLLIAPEFLSRKVDRRLQVGFYTLLSTVLLGLIFARLFPDCYIEGQGLTQFKIVNEYIISLLLGGAILRLVRQRDAFNPDIFVWLVTAIAFTIISELAFTSYASVYGFSNFIGHIFKIFAFYCIYRAILETGLRQPYALLFQDIHQRNEQLQQEVIERQRAEDALRESKANLQALIDNTQDIIAARDRDFRVTIYNDAFARIVLKLFGTEAAPGLKTIDYLPQDARKHWKTIINRVLNGERHREVFEYEIDGERKYYDLAFNPIMAQTGDVVGIAEFTHDITEHKRIEETLRQYTERLQHLNTVLQDEIIERERAEGKLERYAAELERSNQELEQFGYIISHDLQAPVRTMEGFLRLLKRRAGDQLDDNANEYIDRVMDNAHRMQEMIMALLDLSRVETHGKALALTDVEALVERALMALGRAIRKSGAEVTYDKLPQVMADYAQLAQVFQNLIANGIKFRREDAPPRVHISAEQAGKAWRFSVADNGIGIDPQQTGRIFQIFQRLHTEQEYPGLGIGLALCKRIVEHHGGQIWVESTPGQGATFYFTLPDAATQGPEKSRGQSSHTDRRE
jgi:PAS domain S-box-containing protein